MAKITFIGSRTLEVFVHPDLNYGNIPQLIAEEAERVVGDDIAVLYAEARPWGQYEENTDDPPEMFRLKLHYSNREFRHPGFSGEYIIEKKEDGFEIRKRERVCRSSPPCH